jgi:hypothetical protein
MIKSNRFKHRTPPNHRGLQMHRSLLAITTLAITLAPFTIQHSHAQIVSNISGAIELRMDPFFNTHPGTGDPTVSQIEFTPIAFADTSASIDGTGFYSVGGISQIDYHYDSNNPGESLFSIQAFADTLGAGDSSGGSASIGFDFTTNVPIRYRFEADAIDTPFRYSVSFNGKDAYARYDTGIYEGTFPFIYHVEEGYEPFAVGWETYVDEGVLPAGTYRLTAAADASVYRSSDFGLSTQGSASLLIQLLGDTDLDGNVGTQDLNNVLNTWNQSNPANNPLIADLNNDGFIGIADLNQVLIAWNADVRPPQPAVSTVPEPATLTLLATLLLTLTAKTTRRPQQGQRHLYT